MRYARILIIHTFAIPAYFRSNTRIFLIQKRIVIVSEIKRILNTYKQDMNIIRYKTH